ncbi:hypothetical protein ACQP10_21310 [Streptosporangium sandarakinum]|uniref:hypothetical protein n=1 Tax=Streptosporangium sandarakinum TaxID=1260955 RepID=UPI003D8FFB39
MTEVLRLRPVVHAAPTADGVHVRGWTSSFTVKGGAGLWRLWEQLAAALAGGVPAPALAAPPGTPEPVARAIELIIGQLREHDMLVAVPQGWGEPGPDLPPIAVAAWLESSAVDPAAAWHRLAGTVFTVCGAGAPAAAAERALAAAGMRYRRVPGPASTLTLEASDQLAVVAGCLGEVGYAVPPGSADTAAAQAAAVARRLPGGSTETSAKEASADATPRLSHGPAAEPPEVLCALVAGAAVHRLLCAAAGLPDPSREGRETPTPHHAVLVARLDPLRMAYHPWPDAEPPREALSWEEAMAALDVLGDPELGLVPAPQAQDLPQLPVNLAACGEMVGYGTTLDAARLHAALSAVARPSDVAIGMDHLHARGLALRLATHRDRLEPVEAVELVEEAEWAGDPAARRWWKALTLRLAVPASIEVVRLAAGVVHAQVSARGCVLGWAVEAEAGEAAAFALLAATAREQARRAGRSIAEGPPVCGATPAWQPSPQPLPWGYRDHAWPSGSREGEARFQQALAALAGEHETPGAEATEIGATALRPAALVADEAGVGGPWAISGLVAVRVPPARAARPLVLGRAQ